MDIAIESKLKSKLESSNPKGVFDDLMTYLGPINQEKIDRTVVVSPFKNFLNECLHILERRLFQDRYPHSELFQAYRLCLRPYMEVADSTEVTTHISLILKTIAKELHRNKERLMESSSLLSIIDIYLEDQSGQSISDVFEYYVSNMISALHIVFGVVSKFALKWAQELETIEEKTKVVCMDILHVLSQLILVKLRIKREKTGTENSWMVGSAVTAFFIATKINLKVKESKEVITNIIVSEWCEEEIEDIFYMMDYYANILLKADKSIQAIEILSLRSEAFWLFLKVHPSYLSKSELEEVSLLAYKEGGLLLRLLHNVSHFEMKNQLVVILEAWSSTKDCIQDLPTPVHIVKTWVEIIQDDFFDSPILFDLLTPPIQKSKRNTWILLEEEWKAYTELCSQFSSSEKMRKKITSAFVQFINTTPKSHCQKAQTRIEKEKTIIDRETPDATIQCLEEAIRIMLEIISKNKHWSSKNLINHQLFVAYCLRDLSETKMAFESGKTLSERILYLIYNIFDQLQLKGFAEDSNVVYKLMIKVYGLMNLSLDKQLNLLWKNGRLSHPICASSLSLTFIQDVSNEFRTYKDHFGKEFLQDFSFLFAHSHPSPNPRISCEMTSKDPTWSHSTFHALIAKGKLLEALSCAKEAQRRLYSELKKYTYNGPEQDKRWATAVFSINTWEMIMSFARDVFSFDSPPSDLDEMNINTWKILQGYLESTLQIGIICEMMGDGVEAVAHFELGKDLSSSLDFPLFVVAFSSLLGKLYGQQKKIDLGELKTAMELLRSEDTFGCSKCKSLLYASVIEHIGELTKIEPTACKWIVLPPTARNFYEMALEKLDDSTWKNSLSNQNEDASLKFAECSCSRASEDEQKRKTKKAKVEEKEVILDQIGCSSYATCLTKCELSNMGCWQCLSSKVAESGLFDELVNLKWEFIRRKMSMKLLSRLGKSFTNSNKTNEVRKSLLRRISVLIGKNPFCYTFSSILPDHFRNLVAKETQDDIFAIERAELLYDISLYLIKSNHSNSIDHLESTSIFSNQNSIKLEEVASWLILAFVLSRDVPIVLQEVSKLLALIYLVSSMNEEFPLRVSTGLSKLGWVFYFHQASIGAHLSCQFLSNLFEKYKDPNIRGGRFDLLRPPNTTKNLQDHVAKFLAALPSTTLVCITLLGHEYTSLLENLLSPETTPKAWILISRKSINAKPVVMLLPLDTIFKDALSKYKKTTKVPSSKWSGTVVDHIAPDFKTIIDDYYFMLKDTLSSVKKSKLLFDRADTFEGQLKAMLRKIEDLWLDLWKYFLPGELANCKKFDKVLNDLLKELGKQKTDINEDHLQIILSGYKYDSQGKTLSSTLSSNKGCYMGDLGYCKELSNAILSKGGNMSQEQMVAFEEALNLLEINFSTKRNPIIFVLDYEIQMLPWESLPFLKNQEVYRMPSVTSINAVLDKYDNQEEQVGTHSVPFPSIDPYDAFFVLNPDGSLEVFQSEFEEYFKRKNFEGSPGWKPTVDEMLSALKSHNIYLYLGHNSGARYIQDDEVKKLDRCCAAILMGCSSGALTLQGFYAPIGTPLSYLMAGSPIIVANLWSMTANELTRFSKKIFENLLEDHHSFNDRERIGACVAEARESYARPLISGAATVCYGVPVGIRRKKEIEVRKSLLGKEKD